MNCALFYREKNKNIFLSAEGHITAKICSDLRKRIYDKLSEKDAVINHIFCDLSKCDYMDSTFMGLIVGFSKKLKEKCGRFIELINPSEKCIELFNGLGIIKLLSIKNEKFNFPKKMENISSDSLDAVYLLNAHEHLMEISEENKKKFELLRSILKKNIDKS